jgi:hypothetical protein
MTLYRTLLDARAGTTQWLMRRAYGRLKVHVR